MKRCSQCGTEYPDASQFCPRDGQTLIATDPLIGRIIAGRYRLTAKLGQGGMGTVYRGEHVRMRRPTAIKILSPARIASPEFVARFEREAELASTINHPNAVAIYDFGEAEDGLVYLAMELLDGEPLSALLARRGRLPIEVAVRIARQSAEALDAAHRRGIVHRDFKPDNVMVCPDGAGGTLVKVVDFGIAKQTQALDVSSVLTQTGSVLGTPTYMSPEQVADHPLDARSDLYSLALTVYQMLSGTVPFRGETAQAVMVKRLLESPAPLRSAAPEVGEAVDAVVMKALEREPHDRQASVLDFVADLELAATSTTAGTSAFPLEGPKVTQVNPSTTAPMTGAVTARPGEDRSRPFPWRVVAAAVALLALAGGAWGLYRLVVDRGTGPIVVEPPPQGPSAEALVAESRRLRRDERYEEAADAARRAASADPKSAAAAVALADALLDLSRLAEATGVATRAAELDPNSAAAHRVLADVYVRDGQHARAVGEANRALALGPTEEEAALAHLALGDAYVRQARFDAAIEAYGVAGRYTAWGLVPDLARLGVADALVGKGLADEAVGAAVSLVDARQRGPNAQALVQMRLAKLQLSAGRAAEALASADLAIATATLGPLRAGAHLVRGFAALQLDRPVDALASADAALDPAGEDKQLRGYAFAIRGAALMMQRRVAEGRAAFDEARRLLPDDPNVRDLARQAGA